MVFTASEDLTSLLNSNFDHTQVTGLTADPSIRQKFESKPAAHESNGTILVGEERLLEAVTHNLFFRSEKYRIQVKIIYTEQTTDSTVLKELLAEVQSVIDTNNSNAARTYDYKVLYHWKGRVKSGVLYLEIDATVMVSI